MKTTMRMIMSLAVLALAGLTVGCGISQEGTITLNLTDAPTDAENVTGVYITITSIEYNAKGADSDGGGNDWQVLADFNPPLEFNLHDLQGGNFTLLGDLTLPAGSYRQLRFFVDAPEETTGAPPTNPGCYVTLSDQVEPVPLFVPSGSTSGYIATSRHAFAVPVGGAITITADFNVRKSVVTTGDDRFILKPMIRLVVDDEAGRITVTLDNDEAYEDIFVYAYDTLFVWVDGEEDADEVALSPAFDNAINSAAVNDEGAFVLAYLPAGEYYLVVQYTDVSVPEAPVNGLGFVSGVTVTSRDNTQVTVVASELSASLE